MVTASHLMGGSLGFTGYRLERNHITAAHPYMSLDQSTPTQTLLVAGDGMAGFRTQTSPSVILILGGTDLIEHVFLFRCSLPAVVVVSDITFPHLCGCFTSDQKYW